MEPKKHFADDLRALIRKKQDELDRHIAAGHGDPRKTQLAKTTLDAMLREAAVVCCDEDQSCPDFK